MIENSFLNKIANQIVDVHIDNIDTITIILPNKRAKVFLIEILKEKLTGTIFSPKIISIEEFVQHLSGIRLVDNIDLLFHFYEVYLKIAVKTTSQTFEEFSNWAKILLQDFNEIDRYLIKPDYVFSYLKDIEVLKRWNLEPESKTELINKQLDFWEKLPLYYNELQNHLLEKKIGYQGLLYRMAINNLEVFCQKLKQEKLIFAGFNALNQAEEKIIQHLLQIEKADIYWDIDKLFIQENHHDAGLFIRRFMYQWPYYKTNTFNWIIDEFSTKKNIQIIGTSKSIGQTKIVSNIIKELKENDDKLENIALVLGDENLLLPTLYSLPNNVDALNVTMGYPAKNNPIQLLISKLFKLHNNAISRNRDNYVLYYKDIIDVLSNPILEAIFDSDSIIQTIKRNNITFINHQRFISLVDTDNEIFNLIFQRWNIHPLDISKKLSSILLSIKKHFDQVEQEDKIVKTFLYSIYKVINKLISYCERNSYIDNINILHAIYKELIESAEVSFEGEPLSGLQIMGVLESRVLDFETVIITSVNEGKFPAGKSSNSFIPYDVKREIGLPTYKEKDAIYTYHFYHLLMRAKNIYLLYNTESEGLDGGEKSRFITQLEVEKQANHNLVHRFLQPEIPNISYKLMEIEKSQIALQRLNEIATIKGFSPSALTAYIRNPIQFYLQRVLSLRESEEVEENIAVNTLGTIIHKVLEELYKPFIDKYLSVANIESMLIKVDEEILKQFKEIYKEGDIRKGKNLLAYEVAKRNVFNFLKAEKKSIEDGDALQIIALESNLSAEIENEKLPYKVKISGNVDRIEIRNNVIRIIDYKTGKVEQNQLKISDWQGLTLDIKNEKIIQLLSYALMFKNSNNNYPIEAGIISFKNMKAGFMPFQFQVGKEKITIITDEILFNFKEEISDLIAQILDPSINFEEKI